MNKTYKIADARSCMYPACNFCKECEEYRDGDDDD